MKRHLKPKKDATSAPTRTVWICAALLLATLLAYGAVANNGFVNYDDPAYVTENPHARDGLSWSGAVWALTSTDESNWFPLTRLSHMLDCQLFGLSSGPHHLVNLAFHAFNTLLLFALFNRLTRAPWPSAFVAMAFALHPLHVESVAWIAERKDVLSAWFWLLTLWAYLAYLERPVLRRYLLVVFCFVCGLMSKPMVVTLPFVLLLLDWWPLARLSAWKRALWEKAPLFLLSATASVVTYAVQKRGGAMAVAAHLPPAARLENAIISLVTYIADFFWPANLAVFYPYAAPRVWQWVAASIAVLAFTALAVHQSRRRPFLALGWFWYLGALLPVIGLIQVGAQSHADRYTYIPLIGISMIVAWSAREWIRDGRLLASGAIAAGLVWCALTIRYVGMWKDSETLFSEALRATHNNFVAFNNLGSVYRRQGRIEDAVSNFSRAVEIQPESPEALDNLGEALTALGRGGQAIPHLLAATQLQPGFGKAHVDLGSAYMAAALPHQAAAEFEKALAIDPADGDAEYRLAAVRMLEGRSAEALAHFTRALPALEEKVRRNPADPDGHYNLGEVYALMGRTEGAVAEFSTAVGLRPDDPQARFNLGAALSDAQRFEEASREFAAATRLRPDYLKAHLQLARTLVRLGRPSDAAAEYSEALRLAPGSGDVRRELESLRRSGR